MCMQKVPDELLRQAREARKDIAGFEVVDRYVLKQLVEAGSRDQTVDERLIRAGHQIVHKMPRPRSGRARPEAKSNSKQNDEDDRYSIVRHLDRLTSAVN